MSSEGQVEVDAQLFGLLLDRALDQLDASPPSQLSWAQAAEQVEALDWLDRVASDLAVRDLIDRRIAACLQRLIEWRGSPRDTAELGVALAVGARRSQGPEVLEALARVRRALGEADAGDGELAGRLASMRFQCALTSVENAPAGLLAAMTAARRSIGSVLEMAEPSVAADQLSSRETLEVATALADAARIMGNRQALVAARRALAVVRGRMLASGAVPAGPSPTSLRPIRLSTQLSFVIAAASCGGARGSASRALGCALLLFVDEGRGRLYLSDDDDGQLGPPQVKVPIDLVPVVLRAAAALRPATRLPLTPTRRTGRSADERRLRFLQRIRGEARPASLPTPARIALLTGDCLLAVARRDERECRRARREIFALLGSVEPRTENLPPGTAAPPRPDISRATLLAADLAWLGFGSPADYAHTAQRALQACQELQRRTVRMVSPTPRPDLGSTGGLSAWALALSVVEVSKRMEAAVEAAERTLRVVLASQGRGGWWPKLVAGDQQLDVQLTVLEQLLRVEPRTGEPRAIHAAIRRGIEPILSLGSDIEFADRIRSLAVRARAAQVIRDESGAQAARTELLTLLRKNRTPFGGLDLRTPSEPELSRARIYAALAQLYATDRTWLP